MVIKYSVRLWMTFWSCFEIMHTSEREFINQAHPHSWLLTADLLHQQARFLWERGPRGIVSRYDGQGKMEQRKPEKNQAVFLLAGFSLENVIKAYLIYENPSWISQGRLNRKLQSHRLTKLAEHSIFIPYKRKYKNVLLIFESGIESWARYPCGLDVNTRFNEQNMDETLWRRYKFIARAYAKRMENLLERGWTDPLGTSGRFEFRGVQHLS